jgi:hypothetical protein
MDFEPVSTLFERAARYRPEHQRGCSCCAARTRAMPLSADPASLLHSLTPSRFLLPPPFPSMLQPDSRRAPVIIFFPRTSSRRFRAPGSPPIRPWVVYLALVTGAPPPSLVLRQIAAATSILCERHPNMIPCQIWPPLPHPLLILKL